MDLNYQAELLQTASQLYQLGMEVEKARQKLKELVEADASYESEEMRLALLS